jgi:hypothetical protein
MVFVYAALGGLWFAYIGYQLIKLVNIVSPDHTKQK